jgi:hypothetical protein
VVVFRNSLEHGLGELNMSVFVFAVRVSRSGIRSAQLPSPKCASKRQQIDNVPCRVVNGVNVLLESGSLRVGERAGREIPAAHVDIHAHGLMLP